MIQKTNSTLQGVFDKFRAQLELPHSRLLSWEYCYTEFAKVHNECVKQRRQPTASEKDHLALHLAFYLASWGMYRGSSELLQKDYKVHIGLMDVIFNSQYNELWHITWSAKNLPLLNVLFDKLIPAVEAYLEGNNVSPTATLVTKILLGTLGCTPAYDRYFVDAIKAKGIQGKLAKKSMQELIAYCEQHKLPTYTSKIVAYPQMKIVDAIFWASGGGSVKENN